MCTFTLLIANENSFGMNIEKTLEIRISVFPSLNKSAKDHNLQLQLLVQTVGFKLMSLEWEASIITSVVRNTISTCKLLLVSPPLCPPKPNSHLRNRTNITPWLSSHCPK